MGKIGLLDRIIKSVYHIYLGRKGLATDGGEIEGRILLLDGLSEALAVFKEVHANASANIAMLILVEHAYLTEELRYCNPTEKGVFASMTAGKTAFNDALRALEAVVDVEAYKVVDKTYPHLPQYRCHDMPKDAFHIACIANRTRINNTLRTPGINDIERQVYAQRAENMTAGQMAYLAKQQCALAHCSL